MPGNFYEIMRFLKENTIMPKILNLRIFLIIIIHNMKRLGMKCIWKIFLRYKNTPPCLQRARKKDFSVHFNTTRKETYDQKKSDFKENLLNLEERVNSIKQ